MNKKRSKKINPSSILKELDRAIAQEEMAVPIYTMHLKSTLFLSGFSENKKRKIAASLNRLSRESKGHIGLLKKVRGYYLKAVENK